ncbi:MAG: DUF1343 domain-containing protein [Bacteroidales bacterium]|nr:DUF1343 domain-containing protein [Bacteroidales bacterium]
MLSRHILRHILCAAALTVGISLSAQVKPGIEVLRDRGFEGLRGKRVGLLTNPSGVDSQLRSTIDILKENVNLVALYAPEHGVRGDIWAGGKVESGTDAATGLPVYSLYGATRQPTPEMLKDVDIVVYDIQDVGTRSYTFISCLGLMMRTCATVGVQVMVLDRPNPLGGLKVEGSLVRDGFYSYVSQYRIPYVYGLTVGEIAKMINEEGLNRGQKGDQLPLKCQLTVVPMEGWERWMTYDKTGLPWVMPSPNIPYPRSAICYPCAGLVGEFNDYLNIGIGYTIPFDAFAADWIAADQLKARLDSYKVPGIAWRTVHYTPFYGSCAKKLVHGVQYYFTDYEAAPMTLIQFYVMQAVYELYKKNPFELSPGRISMFNKVCGTDFVSKEFGKRFKVSDILSYWTAETEDFKTLSKKYYIY